MFKPFSARALSWRPIAAKKFREMHFFACLFSLLHRIVRSTWRMPSLRKHSEGGTRFETATLIGLIADEWQFNYIQWTMRLEFAVSGLAYWRIGDVTVMEAPPRSSRQSPALPIAIAGPEATSYRPLHGIRHRKIWSSQCACRGQNVHSIPLC